MADNSALQQQSVGQAVVAKMSDRKKMMILINIIISCIATSLLATALNTALSPLCKDIGISVSTGQWLTSGYTLVVGIITPLTAFFIRKFKTKPLYLCGIVVFLAGLLVDIVAQNFIMLMIGRVLQACGNGILISMAQVVILTIFPVEKRGTVMGWYGMAITVAPVIAPTLSGILVDTLGWRSIFIIVFVVMLISLVWAICVFSNVLDNDREPFDVPSFILSLLAFGGITLGVGNISNLGITSLAVWPALVIGVVAMVFFVMRELRMSTPMLDMKVLGHKDFTLATIASMLLYFVMMGSTIIMPLYVQQIMGRSATISGLVTLPGSLVMAVCSPLAGKIFDKIGIKKLFVVGSVLLLAANVGMFFVSKDMPLAVASVINVVRCAAIGCLMMPLVTWGTAHVGHGAVADATAVITTFRSIAGSIGSAATVGIMTAIGASAGAVAKYGDNADIHGWNIAFLVLACAALVQLIIAIFFVHEKNLPKRAFRHVSGEKNPS